MEFVAMNRFVKIDLEPGIYVFDSDSATGKTLLVKMIKSLSDPRLVGISYGDMVLGIQIEEIIKRKPQLLILDRFDMYDECCTVFEQLRGQEIIVIADYKTQRKFWDFDDTCWVELKPDSLEVAL